MSDRKRPAKPSLRERAELKWTEVPALGENHSDEPMQRLVQELQVHQIELEIQNEELRQAQLELSESRDRYADLYEFAPMAYLTLDSHGNITAANLTAATMLGTSKTELLNTNITRFIDSKSQDTLYFHLQLVYATDGSDRKENCELEIEKPTGEKITVHVESLRYGGGNNRLCRTALFDITQQKAQANALQASEERFHRISEAVSDYIYHVSFDEEDRAKLIPDTDSEKITGYSSDELLAIDDPVRALIHPEDLPEAINQRKKLVKDVDISAAEGRIITKSGDIRWVLTTLSALRDQSGKLVGYDGALQDITDRKVAQLALEAINVELGDSLESRTSELQETIATVKLMATAMTNLLEGIVVVQRDAKSDNYHVVYANKAIARMSRFTTDELIGKTLLELTAEGVVPDKVAKPKNAVVATASKDYSQVEGLRLHGDDGSYCDVEILTSPIYDVVNRVSHLVMIYRDVTARKEVEQELFERDEHLKAILNTVADAIFTINKQGYIRNINPVARSLFGYTSQELLGSHISKLLPSIATGGSDINPIVAISRNITSRNSKPANEYREYTAHRKNGTSIPIGLTVREIDHSSLFTCVVRNLSLVKSMQRQILDVAEEENLRIGRELHDSIQQQLIGTRLLADNILADAQGLPQQTIQAQARLIETLDQTIEDLRTLCSAMVAMHLDGDGLRAALDQLAIGVAEGRNVRCSFDSTGKVILEDSAVSGHIYRIAQEAVNNALKHAKATQITISLRVEKGQLTLEVCDDGIGIRDKDLEQGGTGLQIMRYRAGLISGNLEIHRPQTGGTAVICSVSTSPHLLKHPREKRSQVRT